MPHTKRRMVGFAIRDFDLILIYPTQLPNNIALHGIKRHWNWQIHDAYQLVSFNRIVLMPKALLRPGLVKRHRHALRCV